MLATSQHGKITYFFASGGHFAGAVYQGHRCIAHKTFHRCELYYHFTTALLLIYYCFTADTSSEQRRARARLPATRAERWPSQLGQACGDTTRRCSRFYYSVYLLYWYKVRILTQKLHQQDIADLLKSWKAEIDESERIFVRVLTEP